MDSDGSHVAAVSQAPTVSAGQDAANSGISRPRLKTKRTAQGARTVHELKSPYRMRRPFVIRGISRDNALPKLERKVSMDLDENNRPGKVKKSKTKLDTTKDDKRDPLPRAKLHEVYLNSDPIEDEEAALASHKNFLEKVFGSRASEIIIACSFTDCINSFLVWLTAEEVAELSGDDEVVKVRYCRNNKIYFEG